MYTFGFNFRPWRDVKSWPRPGNGEYIAETAAQFGIDDKIHYGLNVVSADWSSPESRWTVTSPHEASRETRTYSCNYLISCTGYYNYDAGYLPTFPGGDDSRAGASTHSSGRKTSTTQGRRSS